MARRSFWLATGVVAGAASSLYAERKLRQTLEAAQSRLQPDALVNEAKRSAGVAARNTGARVRDALSAARQEKQRREDELWTELGAGATAPAAAPAMAVEVDDRVPAPTGAAAEDGAKHLRARRVRRIARRSPSHLAN